MVVYESPLGAQLSPVGREADGKPGLATAVLQPPRSRPAQPSERTGRRRCRTSDTCREDASVASEYPQFPALLSLTARNSRQLVVVTEGVLQQALTTRDVSPRHFRHNGGHVRIGRQRRTTIVRDEQLVFVNEDTVGTLTRAGLQVVSTAVGSTYAVVLLNERAQLNATTSVSTHVSVRIQLCRRVRKLTPTAETAVPEQRRRAEAEVGPAARVPRHYRPRHLTLSRLSSLARARRIPVAGEHNTSTHSQSSGIDSTLHRTQEQKRRLCRCKSVPPLPYQIVNGTSEDEYATNG